MQIQIENLVNQINDLVPQGFQHFKSAVFECCHGYINLQLYHNNLCIKSHIGQLILLKRNKHLIPRKPDSAVTVLLDLQYYLDKMLLVLEDDTKCSKPIGGIELKHHKSKNN